MQRVMIGTPAHDGKVGCLYADSLVQTLRKADPNTIIIPIYWPGEALIQRARNELLRMAIESKVDDLVFIDGDQGWPPEAFMALIQHPVDVVGCAVRRKQDNPERYNVTASGGPNIPVDIKTGLWVVDAIGTGFLRLSRKALAALWADSEEYRDSAGHKCRMAFDLRVVDGYLFGEDVVACAKLRRLGFAIHVDPRFAIAHVGAKTYGGNFGEFIGRLRREKAAAEQVAASNAAPAGAPTAA